MKFYKLLLFIALLWVLYPIAHMIHILKYGNIKYLFDFSGWILDSLIVTFVCIVVYIIYLTIKFLRRGFEVEMYEYKTIPYEDFVTLYVEEQRDCALEYQKYTIRLEKEKEGYMCRIFGETGLIKEMAFQNQEDLLKEKIISGQTIKELWKEIDYQDTSGIVRGK